MAFWPNGWHTSDDNPLKNGNIAANLPQYCKTFAIYMEGLLPVTMKMSTNGKHGKWNKTKKKHLASLSLWKNCGKQIKR
jgi:hypothetical protein